MFCDGKKEFPVVLRHLPLSLALKNTWLSDNDQGGRGCESLQGLATVPGALWAAGPNPPAYFSMRTVPLSLCPWSSTVEFSNVTVSTWGQGGLGSHCEIPTRTYLSLWLLFLLRHI